MKNKIFIVILVVLLFLGCEQGFNNKNKNKEKEKEVSYNLVELQMKI